MTWIDWTCWGHLGLMLGQAVLMWIYAFEHFRFHRGRSKKTVDDSFAPSVTLIAPCKGIERDIEAHLASLFQMRYPQYEVCFVVEAADDPVVPVIHRVRNRFPQVPSRLIVAGLATDAGQKVHNLIRAVRAAGANSEVLAFVDSDAGADSDRLWRLVGRLRSDPCTVGSGYRWYRPVEPTLPNLTLSALNNLVLLLAGPSWFNLIWGGAWAIRRETFAQAGLPEAWDGALSDDLVASRLAHARGLKVAYEPHCLATSPADFTWGGVIEFARRQYVILRINMPLWWWGGVLAGGMMLTLLAAGPVLAMLQAARGGNWLSPLLVSAAYYALTAWRAAFQLRGIRPFVRAPREDVQRVERINIWAWPLLIALNWVLLLSTAFGRTITWRGITYRMDGPQRTAILSRPEPVPLRKAA